MEFSYVGLQIPHVVTKEWDPDDVFDVLASEVARHILVHASRGPVSADELAATCDASLPTIYRRINVLQDYDLLLARRRFDGEGHHYQTFQTTVDRIQVEVDEAGIETGTEHRPDVVDQFEAFWSDLGATNEGEG